MNVEITTTACTSGVGRIVASTDVTFGGTTMSHDVVVVHHPHLRVVRLTVLTPKAIRWVEKNGDARDVCGGRVYELNQYEAPDVFADMMTDGLVLLHRHPVTVPRRREVLDTMYLAAMSAFAGIVMILTAL